LITDLNHWHRSDHATETKDNLNIVKHTTQSLAGLLIVVFGAVTLLAAPDKRLDFWDEGIRLFGTAGVSGHVDSGLEKRRAAAYVSREFSLDHAEHRQGDTSVVFTPPTSEGTSRFGFVAGLWGDRWALSPDQTLRFWLQIEGEKAPSAWKVILVDHAGKAATATLAVAASTWTEMTFPLQTLNAPVGFDWGRVALCEFEGDFGGGRKIRLDDVRFEGPAGVVGVTDKTVAQRMAEAEASRAARRNQAWQEAAFPPKKTEPTIVSAFAKMLLNVDLEAANRLLVEELQKSSHEDSWSLLHTPLYCRFYYLFSNRSGKYPGRMTPETEKLLLATLWKRTAEKNDIFWARESTWYLDGSENHDLNAKVCNLVTARIFMNEPEYRERIYPDYGFGGGYHYGHAGYYGAGIDPATRHGGGRANLANGGKYKAADHYAAWLKFIKVYFRGRFERGFLLEYGSPTYSKHSLGFIDLAYQFGGDKELHRTIEAFFNVFWADWSQVSISGIRGGPKTRHHRTVGVDGDKGTTGLINFQFGGPGSAGPFAYWNLLSDYRPPKVIWRMALDREGLGVFTYQSRGIGEEENVLPRPLGTERSLVVDTDARFLKYVHVTPDYVLGTQMDHPSAVHSHLSVTGRWHGMIFAQSPAARIVPVTLTNGTNVYRESSNYDMEAMYQTVQSRSTLIVQQSRRWYAVHPDWYPVGPQYNRAMGIWLGNAWDRQIERDGWIFVQKGTAYAAIRPVLWDEEHDTQFRKRTTGNQIFFNTPDDVPTVKLRTDSYRWNHDRTIIELKDNHTATIIEAGRREDYATLEAFMTDVLDNPLALHKTVVPGDHILVYTGCGKDAQEIVFSCAAPQLPTVGGRSVNYSYPMTWESPFIKSEYKSGRVQIDYAGEQWARDFTKE
jgi:hypothetical protein